MGDPLWSFPGQILKKWLYPSSLRKQLFGNNNYGVRRGHDRPLVNVKTKKKKKKSKAEGQAREHALSFLSIKMLSAQKGKLKSGARPLKGLAPSLPTRAFLDSAPCSDTGPPPLPASRPGLASPAAPRCAAKTPAAGRESGGDWRRGGGEAASSRSAHTALPNLRLPWPCRCEEPYTARREVRRSRGEKIQNESTQPRLGSEAPPWRPAQCAGAALSAAQIGFVR